MKTLIITICALSIGIFCASAQSGKPKIPALPGWSNLPGDEFNGTAINKNLWGLYGDPDFYRKPGKKEPYGNDTYGNNKKQGMAQTYRSQMITVKDGVATIRATRDAIETGLWKPENPDKNINYGIKSRDPLRPKHGYTKYGWWSGFLSSRNADNGYGHFYPLYSRIEIKAKVPYEFGVWPGLWLRHRYGGAGTFEIDLLEFFVHDDDRVIPIEHDGRVYDFRGKYVLHQSLHSLDKTRSYTDEKTGQLRYETTSNINDFGDRVREVRFNPGEDYHIYGAQIDPLPGDSGQHLAVSFLLDGRVRSVYTTNYHMSKEKTFYKYNKLLEPQYINNKIDSIWDVAINEGVGGKPDTIKDRKGDIRIGGILYPELNPKCDGNINQTPHNYYMNIDWLRAYKRTNKLLWIGSSPLTWKWDIKDVSEKIPAERFAGIQVGDQIVVDIDTLYSATPQEVKDMQLDLCDRSGNSLITLKPQINKNDAQVTFVVDNQTLCNALRSKGCTVKGKNIHLFSVSLCSKNNAKWVGFKQIQWGETLIPAEQFKDITAGSTLEIIVRDVEPKAQVFLRQFKQPEPGKRDRPALSSDKEYGNILNLTEGSEENTYTLMLNAQAVQELKNYGLAVTGKGYYLRSVRVLNDERSTTALGKIGIKSKSNSAVYTIDGIKVADQWQEGTLPHGIYVVDGRKIIVK